MTLPQAREVGIQGNGFGLRVQPRAHEGRGTAVREFGDADEVRLEEVPDHVDESVPNSFGAFGVGRKLPAPGFVVGVCKGVEVGKLKVSQSDRGMHGDWKGEKLILSHTN